MRLIFWHPGNHLLIIRPLKYNLDLPWVMSFLLVPHLPRLIGWERRTAVASRLTDTENLYIDWCFFISINGIDFIIELVDKMIKLHNR